MERTLPTANPFLSKALWRGYKDTCFPTSLYSWPMDPQRVVPELQKLFFGQVSIWYIDLICSVFWANLPTEGARLGHFLFLILSSLWFPCTVVFHFRLHYWRKNWEIKGFADGARTCACYLIMSQVLRGKKKSFWDQSCMKDLDFSWRGKREQKKKKSVCLKNSHKICKILKLKVLQCRGTCGRCEQARLGPLGTVLGWGLLSVKLTARWRCGWRELTLKIEMALGKTRK